MKGVYETAVHCYINNMICHDEYITEEAAEYLNSHPAFTDSHGCIMNPGFFNKYFLPELMSGNHEPVLDRYRDAVQRRKKFDLKKFDLADAEAFLAWLDPKWTEYRRLGKSEFFKGTDLKFANDGIEFMDI